MANGQGPTRKLSVAEFLDALDRRLGEMDPKQLRAALMTHAERVPSAERRAFLAIFETTRQGAAPERGKRAGRATKAETLLQNIDALVGAYAQRGAGLTEEDEWEDEQESEAWMEDDFRLSALPAAQLDSLFKRTDEVFRGGDLSLAREAYRRLLSAVASGQEESVDEDDAEGPELRTDLSEAKARYYRALYETTTLRRRIGNGFWPWPKRTRSPRLSWQPGRRSAPSPRRAGSAPGSPSSSRETPRNAETPPPCWMPGGKHFEPHRIWQDSQRYARPWGLSRSLNGSSGPRQPASSL